MTGQHIANATCALQFIRGPGIGVFRVHNAVRTIANTSVVLLVTL